MGGGGDVGRYFRGGGGGGVDHTTEPEFSVSPKPGSFANMYVQSRSSQSDLFLGSYANMHVYDREKFTVLKNSLNSFCVNLISRAGRASLKCFRVSRVCFFKMASRLESSRTFPEKKIRTLRVLRHRPSRLHFYFAFFASVIFPPHPPFNFFPAL